MPQHLITLARTQRALTVNSQETLLVALERYQLPLEYQCRVGYCGACRLQRLQGAVCYQYPPLANLQANEILPCCCKPLSDLILKL